MSFLKQCSNYYYKTITSQIGLFVVGTVFGQHSHTLGPSINWMLKVIIDEKSIFVDPSHTSFMSEFHEVWCPDVIGLGFGEWGNPIVMFFKKIPHSSGE